jgi:hypothetical protein
MAELVCSNALTGVMMPSTKQYNVSTMLSKITPKYNKKSKPRHLRSFGILRNLEWYFITDWPHLQGSSGNIHMHAVATLANHELVDS